jgi:hypothetical protein
VLLPWSQKPGLQPAKEERYFLNSNPIQISKLKLQKYHFLRE